MQDMKLQDTNLQDIKRKALNSTTWKCKTWIAGQKKEKVLTETTLQCRFLLLFLNTQQCDALGVNDYSSLRPSLCTRLIMDCAKWNQLPVTVTSSKTRRNAETDRRLLKIGHGGWGRKLRHQLLHLLEYLNVQSFRLAWHQSEEYKPIRIQHQYKTADDECHHSGMILVHAIVSSILNTILYFEAEVKTI